MGSDESSRGDAPADAHDANSLIDEANVSETPTARSATNATARPVKRSFSIRGHRTSISLESAFWEALREQAEANKVPVARIVADIDGKKGDTNLSSAIRVWILGRYRPGIVE